MARLQPTLACHQPLLYQTRKIIKFVGRRQAFNVVRSCLEPYAIPIDNDGRVKEIFSRALQKMDVT